MLYRLFKNVYKYKIYFVYTHSIAIVDILEKFPPRRLTQSKMGCIKDFVETKLFSSPNCRAILLPVFCKHIKDHLESKEEVCFMPLHNALLIPLINHRKLHIVLNLLHRYNMCLRTGLLNAKLKLKIKT